MRFAVFNPDAERREGLKALLRQIDRRARFNEAPDWRSAERVMQRFAPNLFVIDWHRAIRAGELRHFANRHRTLPIAVLVDSPEPPAAVQALLDEGARGIIRRTTDSVLIVKLLELILLGGDHLPADVLREPWRSPVAPPVPALPPVSPEQRERKRDPAPRRLRPVVQLSPRQEQILRCVHMGSTNKTIARALGISEGTVKVHLTSIFQQLGAPNRAAAVAIYNGLLTNQLAVLRTEAERARKPVFGQHGCLPLRHRGPPPSRYPWQGACMNEALPMAAEPVCPWGGGGLAQCVDESGSAGEAQDDPIPPACRHVLPSNE